MVDVDSAPDIADQFDVMTIPTFLFFRDQEVVDAYSGSSVDEVEARVAVFSRSDYKLHLGFIKEDNVDITDFYKENFLEMLIQDTKRSEKVEAKPATTSDPTSIHRVSSSLIDVVATTSPKPGPSTSKPTPRKSTVKKVGDVG